MCVSEAPVLLQNNYLQKECMAEMCVMRGSRKKNQGGWRGSKSVYARGSKTYFRSLIYVNLRNLHFPGVGEGSGPPPSDPHVRNADRDLFAVLDFEPSHPKMVALLCYYNNGCYSCIQINIFILPMV